MPYPGGKEYKMNRIKAGYLPLYIKLYDDVGLADLHKQLEAFYNELADGFEKKSVDVIRAPFCCVKDEFAAAIKMFESADVDCIVTWRSILFNGVISINT